MDATYKPVDAMEALKKPTPKDWHRADIIAAVHKTGTNLSKLGKSKGYSPSTLKSALNRPYPAAEKVIANQIGIPAALIWPSRYSVVEYHEAINSHEPIKPAKAIAC